MKKNFLKYLVIILIGLPLSLLKAETFWYCVKDRPGVRDIATPMLPFTNEVPQHAFIGAVGSSNAVTCSKLNIPAGTDVKNMKNGGDALRGTWELKNDGTVVRLDITSAYPQDPTRAFGGLGTDQFMYVGGFIPTTVTIAGKQKQVFLLEKEGIVPFTSSQTRGVSPNSSGSFTYQLKK